jgi:hypothetical protein
MSAASKPKLPVLKRNGDLARFKEKVKSRAMSLLAGLGKDMKTGALRELPVEPADNATAQKWTKFHKEQENYDKVMSAAASLCDEVVEALDSELLVLLFPLGDTERYSIDGDWKKLLDDLNGVMAGQSSTPKANATEALGRLAQLSQLPGMDHDWSKVLASFGTSWNDFTQPVLAMGVPAASIEALKPIFLINCFAHDSMVRKEMLGFSRGNSAIDKLVSFDDVVRAIGEIGRTASVPAPPQGASVGGVRKPKSTVKQKQVAYRKMEFYGKDGHQCFNCGEEDHQVAECPYDPREKGSKDPRKRKPQVKKK